MATLVRYGSCRVTLAHLSEHLDGELVGRRARRVGGHLVRCERCAAVLASLRRTVQELRVAGRESAPADPVVVDGILQRIRLEGGS